MLVCVVGRGKMFKCQSAHTFLWPCLDPSITHHYYSWRSQSKNIYHRKDKYNRNSWNIFSLWKLCWYKSAKCMRIYWLSDKIIFCLCINSQCRPLFALLTLSLTRTHCQQSACVDDQISCHIRNEHQYMVNVTTTLNNVYIQMTFKLN